MTAVVPSAPGAFGFAPFESSRRTAARSPCSAASTTVSAAAWAIEGTATHSATIAGSRWRRPPGLPATADLKVRTTSAMSNLRENAAAVPDLLDRDVVAVEQRHEQIGEARVLWILHVLPALDPAAGVAEDDGRQRVVVVLVAVAHVAAEHDRRVVEHGTVGFLRLGQPLHELREDQRVERLDLHELFLFLRVV